MPVAAITPQELSARRARGEAVELIDVRTPIEFREVHADRAACPWNRAPAGGETCAAGSGSVRQPTTPADAA